MINKLLFLILFFLVFVEEGKPQDYQKLKKSYKEIHNYYVKDFCELNYFIIGEYFLSDLYFLKGKYPDLNIVKYCYLHYIFAFENNSIKAKGYLEKAQKEFEKSIDDTNRIKTVNSFLFDKNIYDVNLISNYLNDIEYIFKTYYYEYTSTPLIGFNIGNQLNVIKKIYIDKDTWNNMNNKFLKEKLKLLYIVEQNKIDKNDFIKELRNVSDMNLAPRIITLNTYNKILSNDYDEENFHLLIALYKKNIDNKYFYQDIEVDKLDSLDNAIKSICNKKNNKKSLDLTRRFNDANKKFGSTIDAFQARYIYLRYRDNICPEEIVDTSLIKYTDDWENEKLKSIMGFIDTMLYNSYVDISNDEEIDSVLSSIKKNYKNDSILVYLIENDVSLRSFIVNYILSSSDYKFFYYDINEINPFFFYKRIPDYILLKKENNTLDSLICKYEKYSSLDEKDTLHLKKIIKSYTATPAKFNAATYYVVPNLYFLNLYREK